MLRIRILRCEISRTSGGSSLADLNAARTSSDRARKAAAAIRHAVRAVEAARDWLAGTGAHARSKSKSWPSWMTQKRTKLNYQRNMR
jgi:hypothetical protein